MPLSFTQHLQPLLSARAARATDQAAAEMGLPGLLLMETAGRGAAHVLRRRHPDTARSRATVFCGRGNNGGDGFVMARTLAGWGAHVQVFLMDDEAAHAPDARHHLALLRSAQPYFGERLRIDRFDSLVQVAASRRPDVIVDALLGTGLRAALRSPYDALVDWINEQEALRVALDLPSGLHAETGAVLGTAVRAHLTATMAARKPGLVLGEGPACAGEVVVVDIGVPPGLLAAQLEAHGGAYQTTDRWMRAHLPRRAADAHKYSAGLVVALAGSPGLTGAPVMASHAAARAGAGYVVCTCPESAQATLAAHFVEVATLPLPEGPAGLDPDGALPTMEEKLGKAQALLVGPGLGRESGTQETIRRVLTHFDGPAVIDADGLAALSPDFLAAHAAGRWVLTPHAGEFARLAGDVPLDDRVAVVRAHARQWNSVLVLKGMPSVVGLPDGRVVVAGAGSPALATAGTGDVLAGLVAGFMAQGAEPAVAALCALHAGGRAAERWTRSRAAASMRATDLLALIPRILRRV